MSYRQIVKMFPDGPKSKQEQAELHRMFYETDSSVIHLHGCGFISVIYPNGEVHVFETEDVGDTFFTPVSGFTEA